MIFFPEIKVGNLTAQKKIHEIDLREHIDRVEYFANKELDGIHGVHVPIVDKVVDHKVDFLFLILRINDGLMQVLHQHLDSSAFPSFPQVPAKIYLGLRTWILFLIFTLECKRVGPGRIG